MARSPRAVAIATTAGLLAFVVAGCGGSSSSSSTTPSKPSSAQSTQPGQTLKTSAAPNGALKFTKTSLSAKAGSVTIDMTNPSSAGMEHGIAIEGNGVDKDGTVVRPGGTATVTAKLKPGKYEFYCPVDSHKQQGMKGDLTVK